MGAESQARWRDIVEEQKAARGTSEETED